MWPAPMTLPSPSGGYFTGRVGSQWLGGATPETMARGRQQQYGWGMEASVVREGADTAGPRAELLERAHQRMYRRRVGLGKRLTEAALVRGTGRGLARSGETAGEVGEVARQTERDLADMERDLAARLAELEAARQERAEMRAYGAGLGGVWQAGGPAARRQPAQYVRGMQEVPGIGGVEYGWGAPVGRGGSPYWRGAVAGTAFQGGTGWGTGRQPFYSTQMRQWFPGQAAGRAAEAARRAVARRAAPR